jgi:hypothetical protein
MPGGQTAVWLSKSVFTPRGHSELIHELQHMVLHNLTWRGLKCEQSNHEAFCYYLGWLSEAVLEELGFWRKLTPRA